jgi:hypothetical protein
MTTSMNSHFGRTRRLGAVAAVSVCGIVGLGAFAQTGSAGTVHPAGQTVLIQTPTATTTAPH